jgi:hypothetical protein
MKFIIPLMLVFAISACTSTSDFAVAVDNQTIYYNECLNVLRIFYKCELKMQPTIGKPIMQRVQNVIANEKVLKNEI